MPQPAASTGHGERVAAECFCAPPVMPSCGLRARVWVEARHFFSRADTQAYCWLWLLGGDGRINALRMDACNSARDDWLPLLRSKLDANLHATVFHDPMLGRIWRLPCAPVVPLPRWAVSWGHPVQQAIRAFAAELDGDVLAALGRLELPGPFFGSVENYNRLATLPQPVRTHRLQALERFPPLVAPLLLDPADRPDMFNHDEGAPRYPGCRDPIPDTTLLEAMDRGRDLTGALAEHYRVDRALVRSPLFRRPWTGGRVPRDLLRLLSAIPAHARPQDHEALDARLPCLDALPCRPRTARDTARLGRVFAPGWNKVWQTLEARVRPLPPALRDTRDFLRSTLEQATLPPELERLDEEALALAWLVRRGPDSLLEASRRWHAQPIVERDHDSDYGLPATLAPIFGELTIAEGHARELVTRQALIAEGETMHHCVGSYWAHCALRATRIVHLETRDGETATAQYDCNGRADFPWFRLGALRGPHNEEPSEAMYLFARRIQEAIDDPTCKERRMQALRECDEAKKKHEAATRQIADRRVPRPALRPLDPSSRRELTLVLAWCRKQKDWRSRPGELFRGYIAGFRYAEGPRLLARLDAGDPLQLVREPHNPHDPLAVRVDWHGHKLGYVPREHNAPISRQLDAGVALAAAILAVHSDDDAWSPVEFTITTEPVRNPIKE